jgi:hypothetical protein
MQIIIIALLSGTASNPNDRSIQLLVAVYALHNRPSLLTS